MRPAEPGGGRSVHGAPSCGLRDTETVRNTWLLAAAFAVSIGTSCGGTEADDPGVSESAGVRVASFDFAESRLIAELYAQALEGQGFEVVRLGAVGPREVIAPALEQGHVDVVPEYLGTAAQHFGAVDDGLAELTRALASRGLRPLDPAPAEDVNVFVVTEATARRHGLVAVSDLAGVASDFAFGGPVECPGRPLCLLGLERAYGLSFASFVPHRTLSITAEALIREEVDVGVMFSTAAELTSGPFVVLDDDRDLQPAENVVPLVRRAAVDRWGQPLVDALDAVSRMLTTSELQAMNRRAHDGAPETAIAASWLLTIGLADD